MADEYNPPLQLNHLKLFKQQADKLYAKDAELVTYSTHTAVTEGARPVLLTDITNGETGRSTESFDADLVYDPERKELHGLESVPDLKVGPEYHEETVDLFGLGANGVDGFYFLHFAGICIYNKSANADYMLDLSACVPSNPETVIGATGKIPLSCLRAYSYGEVEDVAAVMLHYQNHPEYDTPHEFEPEIVDKGNNVFEVLNVPVGLLWVWYEPATSNYMDSMMLAKFSSENAEARNAAATNGMFDLYGCLNYHDMGAAYAKPMPFDSTDYGQTYVMPAIVTAKTGSTPITEIFDMVYNYSGRVGALETRTGDLEKATKRTVGENAGLGGNWFKFWRHGESVNAMILVAGAIGTTASNLYIASNDSARQAIYECELPDYKIPPRPKYVATERKTFNGNSSGMSAVTQVASMLEVPAISGGKFTIARLYWGTSRFLCVIDYPEGVSEFPGASAMLSYIADSDYTG